MFWSIRKACCCTASSPPPTFRIGGQRSIQLSYGCSRRTSGAYHRPGQARRLRQWLRYPPRAAVLAAGAAVGLPGAPAGGHGELLFPTVDAAGRSVGAGRRNRPCVAGIGIAPARGRPAWAGLQRRLPCADRIQLVERGADPAAGKQPRHGSSCRGRDPVLAASGRGSVYAPGDSAEPSPRPSASPHDRRTCNRPETGTRLSLSPSRSPPSSNWLFEASRRGGESRSLALVPPPPARKAPASFSPWRAGISRGLRACCVISTLVGRSQDRRWGLPRLRFLPSGCLPNGLCRRASGRRCSIVRPRPAPRGRIGSLPAPAGR